MQTKAMTQAFNAVIHDVVILSGQTSTRAINALYEYSDATAVFIQSPAALDAGTYLIEVSSDGATWSTLSDAGGDVTAPAAGKSRQYTEVLGSNFFRITGPSAAANRTFRVSKQWTA